MADLVGPFGFVNPARDGKPPFARSFTLRPPASRSRTTASFSPFSRLPVELRLQIIKLSIEDAHERREVWFRTQGNPLVKQSRRGVLRVQLQDTQPPSQAHLACISKQWQEEVEKQLFKTLRLGAVPDSGPNEYSDLIAFSAIVTGPRRRYLKELRLKSCNTHSIYEFCHPKRLYCTEDSYEGLVSLLRTLGTWAPEQVADELLEVNLDIDLRDFPLHHLQEEINRLPKIPCIGALGLVMGLGAFSKLPLALLCLIHKLPCLRSAQLWLYPWCFSHEGDRDNKIQELFRGFSTETPQLAKLDIWLPFICGQPKPSTGGSILILTGPPIASIRDTSYRLKTLVIRDAIDLRLFFKCFCEDTRNEDLAPRPSWPHLERLRLEGPIVQESIPLREAVKDAFLRVIGCAIREMPRLKFAKIGVHPVSTTGLEGIGMFIGFSNQPKPESQDIDWPRLVVALHTPSSSAVRIWKDAIQHTKRMNLEVLFVAIPSRDDDGNLIDENWQVWKE